MSNAVIENQLSSQFKKASTLSRFLAELLRVAFWLTLFLAIALIGIALLSAMNVSMSWGPLRPDAVVSFNSPQIPVASLSGWSKLGIGAAFLMRFGPSIAALHYGHRAFTRFARGEVFNLATIADIRSASLWMVVTAFATGIDQVIFNTAVGLGSTFPTFHPATWFAGLSAGGLSFNPGMFFFGLCTYVAARVMAEARRIADDNASFI